MDEILYIARIDGRPWTTTTAKSRSLIPFLLLFASVETTRYLLNSRAQIPEFEKYFVIAMAAIIIVFLQDSGVTGWRKAYTTKMAQDVIFVALVSTVLFNAASAFFPAFWVVYIDPHGKISDPLMRVGLSCAMSFVGIMYLMLRTHFHRAAEYRRLHARPSAHLFLRFRARESRCLFGIYAAYFIVVSALLSYLLTKAA